MRKTDPESKEAVRECFKNRSRVIREKFSKEIQRMREARPGAKVVLHHLDWNDPSYERWENVVPMYQSDHIRLHSLSGDSNPMKNPESVEKMRKSLAGRKQSPELIQKRKEAYQRPEVKEKMSGPNNPMFGKTHSEETQRKISEKSKGERNPMSGRTGKSAPCYGRTGEKHPLFGVERTEEEKRKISEGLKRSWARRKRS
jgi:hypothetical protein